MIVGSWVVLAASYEAKAYGIRTAMSGAQARRLCPQAIVVEPRFSAYTEASKAVYRVFDDTTPLVEGLSIDEAFLDVRGHGARLGHAARDRRAAAARRARAGRAADHGRASRRTKFLAKVASGVAKPDGLLVVPPDGELAFLHPLPGRAAVGRRAGDRAQAARARDRDGRAGRGAVGGGARAAARARLGPPPARARPQPRPAAGRRSAAAGARSARSARSAARRRRATAIDAALVALVDRVTRRMRAARRVGRTVVLRLRFDDFTRATRSHTLPRATAGHRDDPRRGARAAGRRRCR